MTELRSEKFDWFGPSPIEPFNLGVNGWHRSRYGHSPQCPPISGAAVQLDDCSGFALDPGELLDDDEA